MLIFTPLSGGAHSTKATPVAYVLQVDDVKILLDCGSPDWVPELGTSDAETEVPHEWEKYCQALREVASSVDLILLSHGDLSHSGLFPYAHARWNLRAPTYSTLPVQAMARMAVTEDIEGVRAEEDIGEQPAAEVGHSAKQTTAEDVMMLEAKEPPRKRRKYVATLQEVNEAFDSVHTLRYSQPTHLQGKCQGLTIIPFNAGHTLGGTIWKIRSPSAGTIMYAVDMNHMKERHLDGTVLMRPASGSIGVFEPLARPDLLITDSIRSISVAPRRKDRDAALIDTITSTLMDRASVLMPCDASSRVLELLVLLDQHWKYARLKYPICLISRTGREMLTFVRSMMEWMGGTISKEDIGEEVGNDRKRRRRDDNDDEALGPLALRFPHLEFFPTPQALVETYSSKDPKVILAVPASLSHGPSRHFFSEFAAVPGNVVLLTNQPEIGTLGRELFDRWNDAQRDDDKWDKGKVGRNVMMDGSMVIRMNAKIPLSGAELEEHLAKERAAKEKEAAEKAALERQQRLLEADEVESESDEESDSDAEEHDVEAALDDSMHMDTGGATEPGGVPDRRARKTETADWGLGMDADDGLTKNLLSFDIYLKGNVARMTSFFKSTGAVSSQGPRFRMFPYLEKRRRVDEYGETIDVGMWLRKGKVLEEEAEDDEAKDAKRRELAEEEARKAPPEPPSKFVSSNIELQLACRLLFIDLEGLNDGRAVKSIVPQVNPRKMIIVRSTSDATDALIQSCGSIRSMTKDIYAPAVSETITIGQQTNSFSISLSDELLSSLRLSTFEDNEVGLVMGRVSTSASSTIPTLELITGGPASSTNAEPAEEELPKPTQTPNRPHLGHLPALKLPTSTLIGDLKLTVLKSRLTAAGIQAELVGEGVLICGQGSAGSALEELSDVVAVRKIARGRVVVEGNASEMYYTVRREVYGLYARVAAA